MKKEKGEMKNERLEMRVELSRVLPHPLVLMWVTAYAQKPTKKANKSQKNTY